MRSLLATLALVLTLHAELLAQAGITWTQVPAAGLPSSVRLFRGERNTPLLKAWYIEVDMNDPFVTVRPYISTVPGGKETVPAFSGRVGAYAAVNGGYFDLGGSTSYSAVVYPGEVRAQNVASVVRGSITHPVTRSFFGLTDQRQMGIRWIYHFGNAVGGVFTFAQPTPNLPGVPAPVPDSSQGTRYARLVAGIGGGPTLVKNGSVTITYDPEVFFSSGVGLDNPDPRTAVGITAANRCILLVADGRSSTWSEGVSLPELAAVMIDRGCVEAMNLDGGGSTTMAVRDSLVNRPLGGSTLRQVPTILAVVHRDSLNVPLPPLFERIIDTGDPECSLEGGGWFPSANPGYWGTTQAQLHAIGTGSAFAKFRLLGLRNALYDVFAWWVSSGNRATDAPVVVRHAGGVDTVRVNQTVNGSQWRRIGAYRFRGDTTEAVLVSDAAHTGSYVVADAIRLTSADSASITGVWEEAEREIAREVRIVGNYPNPFNPSTTIEFATGRGEAGTPSGGHERVRLAVYDLLGREVAVLVDGPLRPGLHSVRWNASGRPSGVYCVRLEAGGRRATIRVMLVQ
jgi:hypothetical protein